MNLTIAVKRKLRFLAFSAFAVLCIMNVFLPVNAAFEETSVGGKAAALGGIFVSACDDVNSIYHNPAGLANIPQAEFAAQYARLYIGLTDNSNLGYSFIGVAQPLGRNSGTLGLGWLRFELAGLYDEDTFMLSYAHPWGQNLSYGLNLKYMGIKYGQDQYTQNALDNNGNATGVPDSLFATFGRTKSNMGLDIGMQYKLAYNYKMGFMIENVTEPNFALQSSISSPLYRTYKIGITHTGSSYLTLIDFLSQQYDGGTDWEVTPAGEKRVSNNIALRGALDIGSRELIKVACGIGYKVDNFQVDYALIYPLSGIQGTMGENRISVLFRFGPIIRSEDKVAEITVKYNEEKQARMLTEKKLKEANAELAKLRKALEEQLSRPAPVVPVVKGKTKSVSASVKTKPLEQAVTSEISTPAESTTATDATAQYQRTMNNYRKSASGMTLPQRLSKVEAMIKKYGSLTNVSEAEQEHNVLSNEKKAQEKYYRDSLDYYRNMAKYGIKKEESIDILKRMINKYRALGIDVSDAQKEMERLQGE